MKKLIATVAIGLALAFGTELVVLNVQLSQHYACEGVGCS